MRTSLKERNDRSRVETPYGDEYVVQTVDGPVRILAEKTTDTGEIFVRVPRGYAGLDHHAAKAIYEIFGELMDQ